MFLFLILSYLDDEVFKIHKEIYVIYLSHLQFSDKIISTNLVSGSHEVLQASILSTARAWLATVRLE